MPRERRTRRRLHAQTMPMWSVRYPNNGCVSQIPPGGAMSRLLGGGSASREQGEKQRGSRRPVELATDRDPMAVKRLRRAIGCVVQAGRGADSLGGWFLH